MYSLHAGQKAAPAEGAAPTQPAATPPAGIGHNYCGVTNASSRPYTDEDLALDEGLKRMDLAVRSGKPWWVSIRPVPNQAMAIYAITA